MWPRSKLKSHAKSALSKSYWYAFLVCLLSAIITGGVSYGFGLNTGRIRTNFGSYASYGSLYDVFHRPLVLATVLSILGIVSLVLAVIGLLYKLFVTYPVGVGKSKFFLSNRKGECDFAKLFFSFKKEHYIDIVKSMAWRLLFTFLWTLLFIIPGIIKAYAYSMVPYILADNPNIGYNRTLQLSMAMTKGYKFKIFVLQLSFIGWYLLGAICCGIGILFVNPYYEATFAEMYGQLRKNAVDKGIVNPAVLNLSQGDYMADNR